jgi:hypothetical protein
MNTIQMDPAALKEILDKRRYTNGLFEGRIVRHE